MKKNPWDMFEEEKNLVNPRIVILTPDSRDKNDLHDATLDFLIKTMPKHYRKILIQEFSDLADVSKTKENSIGAGGEILIIFDRKLNPADPYMVGHSFRNSLLEVAYKMSIGLCNEKKIPNIEYQGELRKNGIDGLEEKFDKLSTNVKEKYFELTLTANSL